MQVTPVKSATQKLPKSKIIDKLTLHIIQDNKEHSTDIHAIQTNVAVEKCIKEDSEISKLPRIKISGNNKRLRCQKDETPNNYFENSGLASTNDHEAMTEDEQLLLKFSNTKLCTDFESSSV